MNIVAKAFTPSEFADYVKSLDLPNASWRGYFCVLHNTGAPTLAERPDGLTAQHIENLKSYYEGLGWHAGPHLFCDDLQIWAFTPLTEEGVHSPTWNHIAYGIEMLGDYDIEEFGGSVRGQDVRANAVAAIAVISHALGIDSSTMRLHKEDPATTHKSCPGKNVDKADFIQRVHDYIEANLI